MKIGVQILIILCVSSSLPILLNAQGKVYKFFAELSIGPSFPVGKFHDKTYSANLGDENPPGIAKIGSGINALIGYKLNKWFNLNILACGQQNQEDANAIKKYLESKPNVARATVTVDKWQIVKGMGGISYKIAISKKEEIFLYPCIMAGICKTTIPSLSYETFNNNGNVIEMAKSKPPPLPAAFCNQLNMKMQWQKTKRFHILVDVQYFISNPKQTYSYMNNGNWYSVTAKYSLSSINLLLGAGISF